MLRAESRERGAQMTGTTGESLPSRDECWDQALQVMVWHLQQGPNVPPVPVNTDKRTKAADQQNPENTA
jgi:hypothetical protein